MSDGAMGKSPYRGLGVEISRRFASLTADSVSMSPEALIHQIWFLMRFKSLDDSLVSKKLLLNYTDFGSCCSVSNPNNLQPLLIVQQFALPTRSTLPLVRLPPRYT